MEREGRQRMHPGGKKKRAISTTKKEREGRARVNGLQPVIIGHLHHLHNHNAEAWNSPWVHNEKPAECQWRKNWHGKKKKAAVVCSK